MKHKISEPHLLQQKTARVSIQPQIERRILYEFSINCVKLQRHRCRH